MPTNIDELQIEINAKAQDANTAIDRLVGKLDRLSASLGKIDTKGLQRFSSGVSILGTSMKSLENVKLPDYTRLAKGIQKFNDIDGAKLGEISSGLRPLADSVRLFSNVNFDNKNLSSFINSITRLANANLQNLANADFSRFTTQITALVSALSGTGEVSKQTNSLIGNIARLANAGENANLAAQALPTLRNELVRFTNAMSSAGAVTQEMVSFTAAIAQLANAGQKAAVTAGSLEVLGNELKKLFATLSTAPNVSRNIIDMTNALANLANQGSRVGSASRSIVRGMNNTTSSMNRARKSTTSLAAAIGKFYATWFLVIRGAKQFVNAIEGTADYIEAYNYYNVALGKIASDWNQDWDKYGYENAEAYADSFTERLNKSLRKLSGLQIDESQQLLTETGLKNLGLNIQEITQYASQLASVTNSVGQTGEVSLAAASAFTKLAGDISSLFNIDFSSAAQNIQSGLIGQSRALYKYGIDITNATLQTYAYNLGLEKAVSEMTQAEKMQLRMIAILDQSKVSWGDLANTINSPSNMLRQFSNNVKEAGMVLGQLFIPVLQKVLPVVNGVVIAIKRLLVSIAQLLGVKLDLDSFGQGYTDLTDGFDDMADSLGGVASAAKKAKAGLRAFDELKVINMPETSGGAGGVGGGAIDLTDEILKATEEYERVWQEAYDRMANKAQEIADRISKTLEPVRKIFEDFAVGDFFQAGEDTSHLVASIFNFFADAIDKVNWKKIGKNIGKFFAGIDWKSVLKSAGKLIVEAIKAAFELYVGMFDAAPLETAIITAIGLLKFTKLGKTLKDAMGKSIKEYFLKNGWKSIGDLLGISALALEVYFIIKLTNIEYADKFMDSMGKLNNFDFKNFDNQDWFNFIMEAQGSLHGMSFSHIAQTTQLNNAFENAPKKSDYKTEEEYTQALNDWVQTSNEFNMNRFQIPGVEYDENGWNKSLVEIKDKLVSWWNDDVVVWWNTDVSNWWNNNVTPWFTKEKWQELWDNVKKGASSKWTEFTNWWKETGIPDWWNNNVTPWFTKEKWKNLGKNIKGGISEKWTEFTNWWENTGLYNWWNNKVLPWFSKEKWDFSGIKEGLKEAWNAAINAIKITWNTFANWINDKLTWTIDPVVIMGKTIFDGATIDLGKVPTFSDIPAYSVGGFPEDGLFMANHGELVGKFANGKTAVANNEMITAGIEEAAYRGFMRAMSETGGMSSNVTFQVEGDPNGMFRVWKQEWNKETRSSGKNPVTIYNQ